MKQSGPALPSRTWREERTWWGRQRAPDKSVRQDKLGKTAGSDSKTLRDRE